ncbi:DUF4169 family protein [Sneathiella glossodoripedis]|uniref:DUF4169 family protein n=1 Tax=Sneathiella glossodoripedis TaxID=418853 RepID=UPI000472A413|nr:DUF4169 family protein [Sneathiella glossodoripedis]
MSNVVNLNKFRKAKKKDAKEKQASENRVKYGRSKAEKVTESKQNSNAIKELDGKKLDESPTET